jgi:hypothetical protein
LPLPGQGKRIEQIVLDLSAKLGRRVTLAEFGEMVGKAEKGRGKPYSKTGVSEWIQERNEPTLAAFVAMVLVSARYTPPGRSFKWVTLGEEEPVLALKLQQAEPDEATARKPRRRPQQ